MVRDEVKKLQALKTWLEGRIAQRDQEPGSAVLRVSLSWLPRLVGATGQFFKNQKGKTKTEAAGEAGRVLVKKLLPKIFPPEIRDDPGSMVAEEDLEQMLAHVLERLRGGVDTRSRALMKGDTLVLWYRGQSTYSGRYYVAGRYLLALLRNPHRSLSPAGLVRDFGRDSTKAEERLQELVTGPAEGAETIVAGYDEADFGDQGGAQFAADGRGDYVNAISDKQAVAEVTAALARMRERLKKLPKEATPERKKLEEDERQTQAYLQGMTAPGGKSAQFATNEKKAATAVRNLVNNYLVPHIELQHVELAEHLRSSLSFGNAGCVYAPDPEETWLPN